MSGVEDLPGPLLFRHAVPPGLLAWGRLEQLLSEAPADAIEVVEADRSTRRAGPARSRAITGDLRTFVRQAGVQVQIGRLERFTTAFDGVRDAALSAAGVAGRLLDVRLAVRLFSPGGLLAFHAHGEAPVDLVLAGRCTWHVWPRATLTQAEHESLHRGGQFALAPRPDPPRSITVEAGQGLALPGRWPHWVEHHGPDPTVTFEVEYWTPASARERKLHDVNWALRRLGRDPSPPEQGARSDGAKRLAFDVAARLTGRGTAFTRA